MMGGDDLGFGLAVSLVDNYSSVADKVTNSHNGLEDALTRAGTKAFIFNELATAAEYMAGALDRVIEPGEKFDYNLQELSAITNVTGGALDLIGDKALALSEKFGGSAATQIESFKQVLSKLGPDIAQAPEALNSMGDSISTLSKTMSGDVVGATAALTTGLNIYAGNLSDPIAQSIEMARQMNTMAAAAQVGSAEVPQIADTIKVAGLAAKNAGINFEELNALIQIMGKGAIYGAEAGTGLRNVLAIMSRGQYMPKEAREGLIAAGVDIAKIGDASIPVAQRLQELSKIQGNAALIGAVFGMENQNAFRVLMENLPVMGQWTTAITGTNSANEQANIIMDSFSERMGRMRARLEGVAIAVFENTKAVLPFVQGGLSMVTMAAQVMPGLVALKSAFTALRAVTWASLAPFLPYVAALAAVIAIWYAGQAAYDSFKGVLSGEVPATGFLGFVQRVTGGVAALIDIFRSWNGETFELSAEMHDALARMGILDFVLNLGTYVVRAREYISGIGTGFMEVYQVTREFLGATWAFLKSVFTPVIDQMAAWGFTVGKATSETESWAATGKVIGYIIGGVLLVGLIAATAAAASFAVAVIAATWPFIALAAAVYGVYYVIVNFGSILDWLGMKAQAVFTLAKEAAFDFLLFMLNLPAYTFEMGVKFVQYLGQGIVSAWDGLKALLLGLISSLPFGEEILGFFGGGGAGGVTGTGNEGGVTLAGPDSGGAAAIGEAVAERRAQAAQPPPATVIDKSSREVQNIAVTLDVGGEKITEVVNLQNAMNDSRQN